MERDTNRELFDTHSILWLGRKIEVIEVVVSSRLPFSTLGTFPFAFFV